MKIKGSILLLSASLALLFLITVPIFAQELQPRFAPPEDFILVWVKRICLIMTMVAMGLIVYTLIFRRRRFMEYQSKWLLFFGICVLPIPVLFLSTAVGLEQSKEIAFCNSCHVMDPFINDMKDSKGETLAALHYKNRYIQREQCWTCHSDYGVFGTMQAKMSGLVDVYSYTFHKYRLPVRMRHGYRLAICLNCHAESALFQNPRNDPEAHEGVLGEVLNNELSCMNCHPMAHPAPEKRSTE